MKARSCQTADTINYPGRPGSAAIDG